ncbi:hypothetical protein DPMN_082552 [Dreissena polymorpha]|uniref:Uncharacterized protein n=1 Tax=Dreissena polymorpha TaxID=45954 RepID=A0A9D3Y747_DREPO|nr:hypothetical protein DPMN_082552 [Dreissena polymorpha]
MQNRGVPSFLVTNTTGDAQALLDGSIMPLCNMLDIISFSMALLPSGNRRGGCLMGAAFPVFMACCTKLVRPMSSGEEENTLLYVQRILLKSAFSDLFK